MQTTIKPNRERVLRVLEWIFAAAGAVICLAVVISFASLQPDSLWPTPGLYFIEITLLGLVVVTSRALDTPQARAVWRAVPWAASGALLAFVILGGFSIGPFLFPAMLSFCLSGAIADIRQAGRGFGWHLGVAVLAAILQGALVFGVLILVG